MRRAKFRLIRRAFFSLLLLAACGSDTFAQATGDGGGPDGAALGDASLGGEGGGGDGGTGGGPFCESLLPAPAFCMDYDEMSTVKAYAKGGMLTIPNPPPGAGGSLKLDYDQSKSNPASLFVGYAMQPNASSTTMLGWSYSDAVSSFAHFRFQLRIGAFSPGMIAAGTEQATVASVSFSTSTGTVNTQLFVDGSGKLGILANVNGTGSQFQLVDLPPLLTWTQIELAFHMATPAEVDLFENDGLTPVTSLAVDSKGAASSISYSWGLGLTQGFPPISVNIDNVVFSRMP